MNNHETQAQENCEKCNARRLEDLAQKAVEFERAFKRQNSKSEAKQPKNLKF